MKLQFFHPLAFAMLCGFSSIHAQIAVPSFGKGLRITAADSSFTMKVGFRFQTLFTSQWNEEVESNLLENSPLTNIQIRRSRIKMDGWAVTPKLKYKCELALSNRDNGGGATQARYSRAANIILDAFVDWNFYKNFSIRVGQMKMPGNRERIISSGNMQLVDRSRLNSRFTLDRDVGFMLKHNHRLWGDMILRETFAWGSGEGKNLTAANEGGYSYTFKVEGLPFGKFQSKGDYVGSAIKYETKPKLAVALAYEINVDAYRTRGQKGSFLSESEIPIEPKTIYSLFADLMFKYRAVSVMIEYASRETEDNDPRAFDPTVNMTGLTYYTGEAFNIMAGYMLPSRWEIAGRYTHVNPDNLVGNDENHYTLGVSKYIVGHKLKVQSDISWISISSSDNSLLFRMQMDIHF